MNNLFKFMVVMFISLSVFATDNSIYIEQSGDNSTIDITQDGSGNQIYNTTGTSTDAATLTGDSQTIDIRQVGSSNKVKIDLNSTVTSGVGVDLTYYMTGNNGIATLDLNANGQGTLSNLVFDVRQTGNNSDLTANILGTGIILTATTTGGTNNDLNFTINADTVTVGVAISGGGGNTVTTNLTSDNGNVSLTAVGASNTFDITQSGLAGVNGHGITLDVTGSSNSFTTNQSGSIDTTIDITSTGSGNTWNINTSD